MAGLFQKLFGKGGLYYVYALGICIMCGRQVSRWHKGYALDGFYLFFVVVVVYTIAFFALTYSFAEMVSIVPFSGGCYGYSRATLGPTMGYLAGMIETGKYILYATLSTNRLNGIFFEVYGYDENHQIVVWLAILVIFNVAHYLDMRLIWWSVGLLGLAIFVIQVIFIFGATAEGSIHNIRGSKWDSNPEHFLHGFPFATYLLSTLDALRTCLDEQSNDVVPKALVRIMTWSALVALVSIVAQSAYVLDDALVMKEDYAYNIGLRAVFPGIHEKGVTLLALPGAIGAFIGFLYCAARQMRSMASSGLLPPILAMGQGHKVKDSSGPVEGAVAVVPGGDDPKRAGKGVEGGNKPTLALLVCSVISFLLLLVGHHSIKDYSVIFTETGLLLNSVMYWFLMAAYMVFYTRFSSMERGLRSPFGIPGAVIVIGFFTMIFIITLHYSLYATGEGVTLAIFFVLVMIYYYTVVQNRQFFSKEEQEKFMKAYVMNANQSRKKGRSGSRGGLKSMTSMADAVFGGLGLSRGASASAKRSVSRSNKLGSNKALSVQSNDQKN